MYFDLKRILFIELFIFLGTGNSFLFKVNGQEIFMKGSNYIPSHILPELNSDKTRSKYKNIF